MNYPRFFGGSSLPRLTIHRKGQVIGVTSVVLTLIFQSNDIVVWHIFFSFCILNFGTGLCSLGASNFVL